MHFNGLFGPQIKYSSVMTFLEPGEFLGTMQAVCCTQYPLATVQQNIYPVMFITLEYMGIAWFKS